MIEHGHANGLSNDYSSTAYYYLSRPARGGPEYLRFRKGYPDPMKKSIGLNASTTGENVTPSSLG